MVFNVGDTIKMVFDDKKYKNPHFYISLPEMHMKVRHKSHDFVCYWNNIAIGTIYPYDIGKLRYSKIVLIEKSMKEDLEFRKKFT